MNCDEAFEAMTDPACATAAELEWHLDLCPRCRQMREVLAPALDRLISIADDANGPALDETYAPSSDYQPHPETSPYLSPEAVRIAEHAAARCAPPTESPEPAPKTARRSRGGAFVRYAAVALLGATVSLTAMGAFLGRKASETPVAGDRCAWIHQSEAETSKPDASRTLVLSCVACHLDGTAE